MERTNTVAETAKMGLCIWATCPECQRGRKLDLAAVEGTRPGITVPSLKAGLRCDSCGRKGAEISISIVA